MTAGSHASSELLVWRLRPQIGIRLEMPISAHRAAPNSSPRESWVRVGACLGRMRARGHYSRTRATGRGGPSPCPLLHSGARDRNGSLALGQSRRGRRLGSRWRSVRPECGLAGTIHERMLHVVAAPSPYPSPLRGRGDRKTTLSPSASLRRGREGRGEGGAAFTHNAG